jgi:hypothetical protein
MRAICSTKTLDIEEQECSLGGKRTLNAALKNLILDMNSRISSFLNKLNTIPDRPKLMTKLEAVINTYVTYQKLEVGESEQEDKYTENVCVQVAYNILEKNLGEILISSIKLIMLEQLK